MTAQRNPEFWKKREIDVEGLLVWAYRDQMVHLSRPDHLPAELTRCGKPKLATVDFTRVGSSRAAPIASSNAAFDAWVVHHAVSALQPFRREYSASQRAVLKARHLLSEEYKASLHQATGDYTPSHNYEVISLGPLLFKHAVSGKRPQWVSKAECVWERGAAIYRGRSKQPIGRELRLAGDDPFDIEREWQEYTDWWQGLQTAHRELANNLRDHILTDNLPPQSPWSVKSGSSLYTLNPALLDINSP